MENVRFITWADHWHAGKYYPKGTECELSAEEYAWLLEATEESRGISKDWKAEIEKQYPEIKDYKPTKRRRGN